MWKEERPKVTQAVSDAAALGDRSENAEYIYGKRRLREIDRRVRFLSKRLEVLQIVDYHPKQEGKVFFGAWVELEDEEGEVKQYRLVGCDEFDPAKNWISIDSPSHVPQSEKVLMMKFMWKHPRAKWCFM